MPCLLLTVRSMGLKLLFKLFDISLTILYSVWHYCVHMLRLNVKSRTVNTYSLVRCNCLGLLYPLVWLYLLQGCRHSNKMEKADILEMAVQHLRKLQTSQQQSATTRKSPVTDATSQAGMISVHTWFCIPDPGFMLVIQEVTFQCIWTCSRNNGT